MVLTEGISWDRLTSVTGPSSSRKLMGPKAPGQSTKTLGPRSVEVRTFDYGIHYRLDHYKYSVSTSHLHSAQATLHEMIQLCSKV